MQDWTMHYSDGAAMTDQTLTDWFSRLIVKQHTKTQYHCINTIAAGN